MTLLVFLIFFFASLIPLSADFAWLDVEAAVFEAADSVFSFSFNVALSVAVAQKNGKSIKRSFVRAAHGNTKMKQRAW